MFGFYFLNPQTKQEPKTYLKKSHKFEKISRNINQKNSDESNWRAFSIRNRKTNRIYLKIISKLWQNWRKFG